MKEFYEIEQMLSELWWRVPFGFLAIVLPFAIWAWRFDEEGCEERIGEQHPKHHSPIPLRWIRIVSCAFIIRFAFIYADNLSGNEAIPISKIEALFWMVWMFFFLPLWLTEELLRMQAASKPDVGNRDAKAKVVLQRALRR